MNNDALRQRVHAKKMQGLYRIRQPMTAAKNNRIIIDRHTYIDFTSNDYLGLRFHPMVRAAMIAGAHRYGFGSGASALISGYSDLHQETEQLFSQWLGVERAVLFNSGYCANSSIISALTQRTETIYSDQLCHASILDGIRLSRCKHIRYQHGNVRHLSYRANKKPPDLIITDSVFSMEGDIAPIDQLVMLSKRYGSNLLIDDAHGVGVLGTNGQGIIEHCSLSQDDYTCLTFSLGKAFNGMGAIVAGKKHVIDSIVQFSRSYCYSTALPPAVCLTLQASLTIIQHEHWRQTKLKKNIQFFMDYAVKKGISLLSNDKTPIKSILTHDNDRAMMLQQFMRSKGFNVSAIRPPTVPRHQSRLRLSLNSLHTEEELRQLIDHLADGMNAC